MKDRRVWCAAVHGAADSQTGLSHLVLLSSSLENHRDEEAWWAAMRGEGCCVVGGAPRDSAGSAQSSGGASLKQVMPSSSRCMMAPTGGLWSLRPRENTSNVPLGCFTTAESEQMPRGRSSVLTTAVKRKTAGSEEGGKGGVVVWW